MVETASEQKEPLHPIGDFAWGLFSRPDEDTFILSPAAKDRLVARLETHFKRDDLYDAVLSLISVAKFLSEEHGADDASAELMDIASFATPALGAQCEKLHDGHDQKKEVMASFLNKTEERRAPRFGDQAKTGTISIAAVATAKRRIIR